MTRFKLRWPLALRRTLDAAVADANYWFGLWNHAQQSARDPELRALVLAHENDRLRSILAQSHYRNPKTGRLSPRGEYPQEIAQ